VRKFIAICSMSLLVACGKDQVPTAPTAPGSTPPTPASSSFELSGIAIGDDGRPIANAPMYVNFLTPSGGNSPGVPGMTDEVGRYRVQFDAKRGGYSRGSTALVWVKGDGYEIEYRWFRPTTSDPHQTLDLRPRLIRQVTAGEQVSVTVAPDDTPCINNVQDLTNMKPYYTCLSVRILVPADGILTVEAVSTGAGAQHPPLELEGVPEPDCCYFGNPLTMAVTAGMVVRANVELLEGLPRQSFALTTTIRQ